MGAIIDTRTQLFGVIGDPVEHSLGPQMHNQALRAMRFPAVYLAFRVCDLAGAIRGVRALGVGGLSVTLPHKVAVLEYLDEVDEAARRIGAVNTIVQRDGRLIGYNTDCFGVVAALKAKTTLAGRRVALLGAGGAARAAGFGLVAEGAQLAVFNRGSGRGRSLAQALGVDYYPPGALACYGADIVVNTTPVGMWPATQAMPVAAQILTPPLVVMDMVYNPLETQLLRAARQAGCTVVDGLAMFVLQGARQLELWTGAKAPLDLMRAAALEALVGQGLSGQKREA